MIKEIKNALQYAKAAHGSQLRAVGPDTGLPYFDTHVVRVTNAVIDWAKPAAALHDVIEDTHKSMSDLLCTEFFTPETLVAVDLLTQRDVEPYSDYMFRLVEGHRDYIDEYIHHYAEGFFRIGDAPSHPCDSYNPKWSTTVSNGRKIARRVKIADIMDNLNTLPDGPLRRKYLGGLHALTAKYKLD